MKGIQSVSGISERAISNIARATGTSTKEVSETANSDGKRPTRKPNLRLEARLERIERGYFR